MWLFKSTLSILKLISFQSFKRQGKTHFHCKTSSNLMSQSMSTEPLSSGEYSDGEIYSLWAPERVILMHAILTEPWLNMSAETRKNWLILIQSPYVRFVGTVLSRARQQVEITIVFHQPHPVHGCITELCVSLIEFQRFHFLIL